MSSLASINIKFRADLKQFSTEMQSSLRKFEQVGAKMNSIGQNMSLGITLPTLAVGGASVKMASDFEESVNKVEVAFGSTNQIIKDFAKTSVEQFGIAEGTALDMAALFGDMATSMGLPQIEAANMSKALVGLAGDLASFKNIGIDQATTALNGVFTGETESLKMLGIVMTEANLAQFALSQGIQKNIKDFTQAEKVQLRYAYVMQQSKNAQGDFARTSNGAANQGRIFSERLKEIGQSIGKIILPAFTSMLTKLNGLLKSFNGLSDGTKKTIVIIGGLAASIGPLLLGFGTIVGVIPTVVSGFTAIATGIKVITAAIASNPIGAIAVGVLALFSAFKVFGKAADEASNKFRLLKNETQVLAEVNATASGLVAKGAKEMRSQIEPLIGIIKSENSSLEVRKKAYDELIKISPEFVGTLDSQFRATEKLTAAYNSLLISLQNKLKAEAKTQVLKKYYDDQADAIDKVFQAQNKMLQLQSKLQAMSEYDRKYTVEGKELKKQYAEAIQEYNNSLMAEKVANNNVANVEKYRQTELQKLIDQQSKYVKGSKEWLSLQEQITALLGTQTGETAFTKMAGEAERAKTAVVSLLNANEGRDSNGALKFLEDQLNVWKQIRAEVANSTAEIQRADEAIRNTETAIQVLEKGPASLIQMKDLTSELNAEVAKLGITTQETFSEIDQQITDLLENGIENLIGGIAEGIGRAFSGESFNFGELLFSSLGNIMIELGKIAIGVGTVIEKIKIALESLIGFPAIAAGVALIALGSAVKSKVSGLQKFQDGGIVGGSSFYGDKILARVNSGELIMNGKQQRALWGMMQGAGSTVMIEQKDILIEGDKLRIVLDRADKKKSRTS